MCYDETMKTKNILWATLLVVSVVGCSVKPQVKTWSFDFEGDVSGFDAVFADYHDDGNNYATYEMDFERSIIPGTTNSALRLQGHNRSDDLFMGVIKSLSGLKPSSRYELTISFTLYTDVEAGSIGIGGSPSESVYIKAGAVAIKPQVTQGQDGLWELNIDKGQQSQGGTTIPVVGNMAKPEGSTEGFVSKGLEVTLNITTDSTGQLWLILGSDSGFEGLTIYYLDDITVTAKPA